MTHNTKAFVDHLQTDAGARVELEANFKEWLSKGDDHAAQELMSFALARGLTLEPAEAAELVTAEKTAASEEISDAALGKLAGGGYHIWSRLE